MGVKLDFNTLFPLLAGLVFPHIKDDSKLGKVKSFVLANPEIVAMGAALVQQALHKNGEVNIPPAVLSTPSGPAVLLPTVPVSTPAPVEARTITGLRLKYFFIEVGRKHQVSDDKLEDPTSGFQIVKKDLFDQYVNGTLVLSPGHRVHLDCSPVDNLGNVVQPGDPILNALNVNVETHIQGSAADRINLSSEYDDHGCTPVLKYQDGGGRGDFYAYCTWNGLTSNTLSPIIVD